MIICVTNQKGGVGKTTTVHNIIGVLSDKGYRTLAIDMDPQCNLSVAMRYDDTHCGLYELMKRQNKVEECIQNTVYGDLLASNILLSVADMEFSFAGREYILRKAINKIKEKYDYILIDTPPHMGVLILNAFTAADNLIIPMAADMFSIQGLSQLYTTYKEVQEYYNHDLKISGLLLTRFTNRTNAEKHIKEEISNLVYKIETILYKTHIRNSITAVEAQMSNKSIVDYNPNSSIALDYKAFVELLLGENTDE